MAKEVIVRYPVIGRFAYIEVREDVGASVNVGEVSADIVESLKAKIPAYCSPEPKQGGGGGSQSSGGGGSSGGKYPDRPDPRANDTEEDTADRKRIKALCRDIAIQRGANPDDSTFQDTCVNVCKECTTFTKGGQSMGTTSHPDRIGQKRLKVVLDVIERLMDSLTGAGGSDLPDDDEPPF